MTSVIIAEFTVAEFVSTLIGSLVIGILNWLLNAAISDRGHFIYVQMHQGKDGRWEK